MNNPDLPQHGFARTANFKLVSSSEVDNKTTQLLLRLSYSKESLELWNYKFELDLKLTISDRLTLELKTTNLDDKEFRITQALHSYFSVSDISDAVVQGLDKKPCFNALSGKIHIQDADINFIQEFDAVFQEVDSPIVLKDKNRTITIKNEGSSSVVVWNPWIEKCSRMSGMSSDSYRDFVCIESANAFENFKTLKPGKKHTLRAELSYS